MTGSISFDGVDRSRRDLQSVDQAGEKAALSLGKLTKVASGVFAGIALGKGFQSAIKGAGDLEQAVANISTIKPEINTSGVFASLNEMQRRVPQSAAQLGDALYDIFSSVNVNQEEALGLLETFAKGAVGAGTDAKTFGTSIMGVLNAYGLAASDAAKVSDVFFNTVNRGVVTGAELAAGLGPVTQSAKAAGVTIEELGGLLAGVTKEGGPAAQNINNLNNLFQKITTTKAQKEINALGVRTQDTAGNFRPITDILGDLRPKLDAMTESARNAAIQKIFPDAQARQGAQTILSQIDFVKEAIDENRAATGSAASAYEKMSATFQSQTKILSNTFNSLLTTVGANILPKITPLISAFSERLPQAFDTANAAASKASDFLEQRLIDLGQVVGRAVGLELNDYKAGWDTYVGTVTRVLDLVTAALAPTAQAIRDGLIDGFERAQPILAQAASVVTGQLLPGLATLARTLGSVLGPALQTVGNYLGEYYRVALPLVARGVLLLVQGLAEGVDLLNRFSAALADGDPRAKALALALAGIAGTVATLWAAEKAASGLFKAVDTAKTGASAFQKTLSALNQTLNPMEGSTGRVARGIGNIVSASARLTSSGVQATARGIASAYEDVAIRALLAGDRINQIRGRTVSVVVSGLTEAWTQARDLVSKLGELGSKAFSVSVSGISEALTAIDGLVSKAATRVIEIPLRLKQEGDETGGLNVDALGASLAGKFAVSFTGALGGALAGALAASNIGALTGPAMAAALSPAGVIAAAAVAGALLTALGGALAEKAGVAAVHLINWLATLQIPEINLGAIVFTFLPQLSPALDLAARVAEQTRAAIGSLSLSDIPLALSFAINLPSIAVDTLVDQIRAQIGRLDIGMLDVYFAVTFFPTGIPVNEIINRIRDSLPEPIDIGEIAVNLKIIANPIGWGVQEVTALIMEPLSGLEVEPDIVFDFLTPMLRGINPLLVEIPRRLAEGFSDAAAEAAAGGNRTSQAFIDGLSRLPGDIGGIISQAVSVVASFPDQAIAALGNLAGAFAQAGRDAVGGLISGIAGRIPEAVGKVAELGGAIIDGIGKLGRSPWPAMIAHGRDAGAGLVVGLEDMRRDVAAAATDLGYATHSALLSELEISSPSKKGWAAGRNYGSSLGGGIEESIPIAALASENLVDSVVEPLNRLRSPVQQAAIDIAGIEVEIARLKRAMTNTEAYSTERAEIEKQIQFLEGWRSKIDAVRQEEEALARQIELSKTALEGATEAREKYLRQQMDTQRFGTGGAGLAEANVTALTENTGESGREAYAELEAYLDGLKDTLGPRAMEVANYLRFLFFEQFSAVTPEDRSAAATRFADALAGVQTEVVAQATFSAQTVNSAITDALFDQAMIAQIGPKVAALRGAIAEATKLSGTPEGQAAIANVGQLVAGFEAEFAKLPASLRGPLLEQYRAAVAAFSAAPNDPAAQQQLLNVVTNVTNTLALIPQNLDRLRPEVRAAAERLFAEVAAGTLTAEEARARLDAIISLIPNDIAKQAPEVQAAARQLAESVERGLIPAEEAVERLAGYNELISRSLQEESPFVRAELQRMAAAYLDLGTSIHQTADTAADGMRRIELATKAAAATANPALASIDAAIQSLILSFLAGAVSAEEFAASMAKLQSAARSVPARGGGGGGGGAGGGGAGGMDTGPYPLWDPVSDPHGHVFAAAVAQWHLDNPHHWPNYGGSAIGALGMGMASGGFVRESSNPHGTAIRVAERGTGGEWILRDDQLSAIIEQAVAGVEADMLAQYEGMAAARLMRYSTVPKFDDLRSPLSTLGAFGSQDRGGGGGDWQDTDGIETELRGIKHLLTDVLQRPSVAVLGDATALARQLAGPLAKIFSDGAFSQAVG